MSAEEIKLPLTPYAWQADQWRFINRLTEARRLPHALLLSGCAGIGKQRFARAFAQLLFCQMPLTEGGCGGCKQCRLFMSGAHPDLLQISPESPGKAIRVDDIREVDGFIAKTAQQGGWKVVILSPAEAMNLNAANALLKNLEEPGKDTLLILVSSEPERMPATVRSRCQKLNFRLPDREQVIHWLREVAGDKADVDNLVRSANGRPLSALRMLEGDLLSHQQSFQAKLEGISSGQSLPLAVASWCKSEDPLLLIEWLQTYTTDMIKQSQSDDSRRVVFCFMDRLVEVKRRLLSGSNPNLQLLWEEVMLSWQAVSRMVNRG